MAINGNGFFRMQDKDGGIFLHPRPVKLDENRNLTPICRATLTGYPAAGAADHSAGCQPGTAEHSRRDDERQKHRLPAKWSPTVDA